MDIEKQLKYLGKYLAVWRGKEKQQLVADRAGITQQVLSNVESGGNCTVETLIKALSALGISVILPVEKESLISHLAVRHIKREGE